jgi:hypothetical protein
MTAGSDPRSSEESSEGGRFEAGVLEEEEAEKDAVVLEDVGVSTRIVFVYSVRASGAPVKFRFGSQDSSSYPSHFT